MGKSSYTFVTPDSVNMIFESLSSLSKTYVFSTDTQNDTKVTKLIKNLVNNNNKPFFLPELSEEHDHPTNKNWYIWGQKLIYFRFILGNLRFILGLVKN